VSTIRPRHCSGIPQAGCAQQQQVAIDGERQFALEVDERQRRPADPEFRQPDKFDPTSDRPPANSAAKIVIRSHRKLAAKENASKQSARTCISAPKPARDRLEEFEAGSSDELRDLGMSCRPVFQRPAPC
jgi:hypothetical protein